MSTGIHPDPAYNRLLHPSSLLPPTQLLLCVSRYTRLPGIRVLIPIKRRSLTRSSSRIPYNQRTQRGSTNPPLCAGTPYMGGVYKFMCTSHSKIETYCTSLGMGRTLPMRLGGELPIAEVKSARTADPAEWAGLMSTLSVLGRFFRSYARSLRSCRSDERWSFKLVRLEDTSGLGGIMSSNCSYPLVLAMVRPDN